MVFPLHCLGVPDRVLILADHWREDVDIRPECRSGRPRDGHERRRPYESAPGNAVRARPIESQTIAGLAYSSNIPFTSVQLAASVATMPMSMAWPLGKVALV